MTMLRLSRCQAIKTGVDHEKRRVQIVKSLSALREIDDPAPIILTLIKYLEKKEDDMWIEGLKWV